MYQRSAALLPTGEKMNPAHPQDAAYFDENQVAYVMRRLDQPRTRPTRVFTSYGSVGWELGSQHQIHHDQTGPLARLLRGRRDRELQDRRPGR